MPPKKSLKECICPAIEEDLSNIYATLKKTPMDKYLYQQKFCGCIRLSVATILICFISFFWAAAELVSADKFIARIFLERNDVHKYVKLGYCCLVAGFLTATFLLAAGILYRKYIIVTIYVWYACIFHLIFLSLYSAGIIVLLINDKISKVMMFRIVGAAFWSSFFWYMLLIVNSYRITLWIVNTYLENRTPRTTSVSKSVSKNAIKK